MEREVKSPCRGYPTRLGTGVRPTRAVEYIYLERMAGRAAWPLGANDYAIEIKVKREKILHAC
jgi:hypothetical protein